MSDYSTCHITKKKKVSNKTVDKDKGEIKMSIWMEYMECEQSHKNQ